MLIIIKVYLIIMILLMNSDHIIVLLLLILLMTQMPLTNFMIYYQICQTLTTISFLPKLVMSKLLLISLA